MQMTTMWILTTLTAIGAITFAIWVSIFLRRCPILLPVRQVPDDAPLISVIVPARNEAANIERCIRSLLAQHYPQFEVIAVDDASTDATPAILARLATADPRLRVITSGPLPPGWTGKNHAVYQGVQYARGTWLLFVDADVALAPGALSAAYCTARQQSVALLTVWTRQELGSFWERVVQPVIIGMNHAIDPWQRISSSKHPDVAFANGQFMLIDRDVYEQIGGHAAVCDEVVEDQKLARRLKSVGYSMLMMDGTRFVSTRMYTSLRSIWEGWSKNNFLTLGRNFWLLLGSIMSVYFVTVSPFVLTIWALIGFKFSHQVFDPLVINLVSIAAVLWTRWRTRRYFDTPLQDYLWHPLGGLIFLGIFINSAYLHTYGRGVTWKGRRYSDVDPVA